ncbi:hypothetical protein PAECIP111893_04200 [Paenibacillus plantiphilus]|uniref:Copper amine oxidase-like N-terminal domain-containing protein n=1 Tax=Paenibacillus plantiphilus TaxID=2905650 RepID=A0ABM9CKJ1_9BACL|nr:stalk domain-containing protein [Paenibacillus plantiphilus]CAH1216898.1 hypothetical protein PAECIP111893_04200 [Paenibacillus plantiphilus]
MKSKKLLVVFSVIALLAVGVSTGVYAAGVAKKISAYQNPGIKVVVDGNTLNLSNHTGSLDPIVYNGNSYVPAKAVAEAMGGAVTWDPASSSVIITTGAASQDNSFPTDNGSSTTPTPATPAPTTPAPTTPAPTTPAPTKPTPSTPSKPSSNKGTMKDPIGLGASFTYTDIRRHDSLGDVSIQYTFAIKKVEPISLDAIESLGFVKPEKNDKREFVMLTVDLKVNNATLLKQGTGGDYPYLTLSTPYIWGVETTSDNYIVGGREFGFEGSLDSNIDKVLDDPFTKLHIGDSKSYSVTGKVLLPIVKGEENLLVLQREDDTLDYDESFIYFKLK